LAEDKAADTAPKLSDAELLARFRASTNRPKGSETLGFEIAAIDQAQMRVEINFPARDSFCNPMGQIQGGFLCAMLDEAMSVAGVISLGLGHVMPTLEMKTQFMRPAMPGQALKAVGKVVRLGRTIAFTEGELYDAAGRLVAKATGTAMPTPLSKFKPG
jgi:uncharacterized protein (TIGR00369 family)